MGFFSNVKKLNDQAQAMQKDMNVTDRAAAASANMAYATDMMATANPLVLQATQEQVAAQAAMNGPEASATIIDVRDSGVRMNGVDPVLQLDLLVDAGGPPVPVTRTEMVPAAQATKAVIGGQLAVRIAPGNPQLVWIEWLRSV